MKATVVGYTLTDKGYLYHCNFTCKSTRIVGENVCTAFSKNEHLIGDEIFIVCSRRGGNYYYYERTK